MAAEQHDLADRIRRALPGGHAVRDVSMFGGLSFMVDGSMVVAARRHADLLVRIDPARSGELLQVPGAKPAVMGSDRPMGPGWIAVAPDHLADDDQLAFWIGVGMEYHDAHASGGR